MTNETIQQQEVPATTTPPMLDPNMVRWLVSDPRLSELPPGPFKVYLTHLSAAGRGPDLAPDESALGTAEIAAFVGRDVSTVRKAHIALTEAGLIVDVNHDGYVVKRLLHLPGGSAAGNLPQPEPTRRTHSRKGLDGHELRNELELITCTALAVAGVPHDAEVPYAEFVEGWNGNHSADLVVRAPGLKKPIVIECFALPVPGRDDYAEVKSLKVNRCEEAGVPLFAIYTRADVLPVIEKVKTLIDSIASSETTPRGSFGMTPHMAEALRFRGESERRARELQTKFLGEQRAREFMSLVSAISRRVTALAGHLRDAQAAVDPSGSVDLPSAERALGELANEASHLDKVETQQALRILMQVTDPERFTLMEAERAQAREKERQAEDHEEKICRALNVYELLLQRAHERTKYRAAAASNRRSLLKALGLPVSAEEQPEEAAEWDGNGTPTPAQFRAMEEALLADLDEAGVDRPSDL